MYYLRNTLSKEAHDLLDQCETGGHEVLQLSDLKFHPIYFLFQTNQCKTTPVQENLSIANYTSNYMLYVVNRSLILKQKNDINDEFTQDMFISNKEQCDDICSIVLVERQVQYN